MAQPIGMHQYLSSRGHHVMDETLIMDRVIAFLYDQSCESPTAIQRAVSSAWFTRLIAHWEFDVSLPGGRRAMARRMAELGINTADILEDLAGARTLRPILERKIRYWEVRPMPTQSDCIVSPADGKALPFGGTDALLPVKSKFIAIAELLGSAIAMQHFDAGVNGLIVRLTPEMYHYVHTPVAGRVNDHRVIEGAFHSCNPTALVSFDAPYTLNRRSVTIIDTDVAGGSNVGIVAVVCVAAMMIGDIAMAYSAQGYEASIANVRDVYLRRGVPFVLFRPGRSTCIVLWNPARAQFSPTLLTNAAHQAVRSRFSDWLSSP
jgi:phosphatidylserine decarboxylase